tara:strand:+ start:223 stop:1149 length:927 start_codon:yes stop_codon:yes gene_type:complete
MAFTNTVPYTIDGTYDSNTNLITFVVSRYNLTRATSLYDDLQWTEQFSIPAGDVAYKRNTNQVFIVQNSNQDQFSIYQGWYDVQADVTYTSIGIDLDNMVDALVAQNTGGGGGTLYYDLTESDAIAALGGSGLVTGALYRITLDGSSEGNTGDVLFVKALDGFYFDTTMGYYDNTNGVLSTVRGIFDASGFAFTAADPTLTAGSALYAFDDSFDRLVIGSGASPIYGIVEIPITGNEDLETITGGFEGMELTIFVTGGGGNQMDVRNTGNIVLDNSTGGTVIIFDDNSSFVKLKKRASSWIQIGWLNL